MNNLFCMVSIIALFSISQCFAQVKKPLFSKQDLKAAEAIWSRILITQFPNVTNANLKRATDRIHLILSNKTNFLPQTISKKILLNQSIRPKNFYNDFFLKQKPTEKEFNMLPEDTRIMIDRNITSNQILKTWINEPNRTESEKEAFFYTTPLMYSSKSYIREIWRPRTLIVTKENLTKPASDLERIIANAFKLAPSDKLFKDIRPFNTCILCYENFSISVVPPKIAKEFLEVDPLFFYLDQDQWKIMKSPETTVIDSISEEMTHLKHKSSSDIELLELSKKRTIQRVNSYLHLAGNEGLITMKYPISTTIEKAIKHTHDLQQQLSTVENWSIMFEPKIKKPAIKIIPQIHRRPPLPPKKPLPPLQQ